MDTDWTSRAMENFFEVPSHTDSDQVDCARVRCGMSDLVPGERGVFARVRIAKGHLVERGIATRIAGIDVRENDTFFTWSSTDTQAAATVSGCGLFYNTLGDRSNARCVPYHDQDRFEIYALRDIAPGEEITIRYDSMNYRDGMSHLTRLLGPLEFTTPPTRN